MEQSIEHEWNENFKLFQQRNNRNTDEFTSDSTECEDKLGHSFQHASFRNHSTEFCYRYWNAKIQFSRMTQRKRKENRDERHDEGLNAIRIGELNVDASLFTDVEVSWSDKRFAKSCNSLVSSVRRKVQLIRNKITWDINWCAVSCVRLVAVVSSLEGTTAFTGVSTATMAIHFSRNASARTPAPIRMKVENCSPLSTSARASFRLRR